MTDWIGAFLDGVFHGNSAKSVKHAPAQKSAREKRDHQAKNNYYKSVTSKTTGNKTSTKNTASSKKSTTSSSSGSGSTSSSGSSGGSTGSTSNTTNGKLIVEDVTGNAVKTEKVVNKANDFTAYNKDLNEEEHRMTDDTPSFHIYVSFEQLGGTGIQEDKSTTKVTEEEKEKTTTTI